MAILIYDSSGQVISIYQGSLDQINALMKTTFPIGVKALQVPDDQINWKDTSGMKVINNAVQKVS